MVSFLSPRAIKKKKNPLQKGALLEKIPPWFRSISSRVRYTGRAPGSPCKAGTQPTGCSVCYTVTPTCKQVSSLERANPSEAGMSQEDWPLPLPTAKVPALLASLTGVLASGRCPEGSQGGSREGSVLSTKHPTVCLSPHTAKLHKSLLRAQRLTAHRSPGKSQIGASGQAAAAAKVMQLSSAVSLHLTGTH